MNSPPVPGKVINSGGAASVQDLPYAIAFLLTVAGVITTAVALPHFREFVAHAPKEEELLFAIATGASIHPPRSIMRSSSR